MKSNFMGIKFAASLIDDLTILNFVYSTGFFTNKKMYLVIGKIKEKICRSFNFKTVTDK